MDKAIESLRRDKILVLERGEEEYERSVATPNLLFRFSRPEYVVQPKTFSQVQAIVKQTRSQKLKITIKGGGHSYARHSTAFRGVSLDSKRLDKVKLDVKSKTVTIDADYRWGHVYKALVNEQRERLIVNSGKYPLVGIGNFILGSGLGPFIRSIGIGCDTLKEATLMTANGKLVTIKDNDSQKSNKSKLFWALRGGGGTNFSVLVNIKLNVKKLRNPEDIMVARKYQ